MRKNKQAEYVKLRNVYPVFFYNGYNFNIKENIVSMEFSFSIGENIHFNPKMKMKFGKCFNDHISRKEIEGIIFHIGMIELISYWKATCSKIIHIKGYSLNREQQDWWKKLYRKGLGEFFYQNSIQNIENDFITFIFDDDATPVEKFHYQQIHSSAKTIVPIGGGKDSVVTLEALKREKTVIPFIINPREATLECARIVGFDNPDDIIILKREIDEMLLQLNNDGFLNGHTPFSAMLAFYTLLAGCIANVRKIALSNESSANEPTIPGTDINHQYSKSIEFEEDFRSYVAQNMNNCAHYYSYLRPFTELEIAEKFAQYPEYFPVFKSCNAGSKENKWCCDCPKCLFAYIILSPFIEDSKMIDIFREDLLDKKELTQYFDELTGIAVNKPFECVGTIEEVNKALGMILKSRADKYLIKHYLNHKK